MSPRLIHAIVRWTVFLLLAWTSSLLGAEEGVGPPAPRAPIGVATAAEAPLAEAAPLLVAPGAAAPAQLGEPVEPKPPFVSVGDRGFSLESGDGSFALRLRTLFQVDSRSYSDAGEVETQSVDDFLVRRARIELTGTLYEQFDFRIMPDLAPATHTLLDAWLRWTLKPALQVQVGKIKLPIGLEREQTREFNLWNEFGYPTALVPNRDVGVNVQGQVLDGVLSYYAGLYNGASDGASVVNDTNDGKTAAARLFATPARGSLRGLGIGVAATHGTQQGPPSPYRTVGQQIFHRWRGDVVTDGEVSRLAGQLYFFRGPFGALSEWVVASQEVQSAADRAELENTAWQATASWVLTGEDATWRGVKPKRNVDPAKGQWGAWQLVARVTELDVDDDAFPAFADPAVSSSRALTAGVGVHWYLNQQIRVTADYNHTELDGGEIDDEDALAGRVQFRF